MLCLYPLMYPLMTLLILADMLPFQVGTRIFKLTKLEYTLCQLC